MGRGVSTNTNTLAGIDAARGCNPSKICSVFPVWGIRNLDFSMCFTGFQLLAKLETSVFRFLGAGV